MTKAFTHMGNFFLFGQQPRRERSPVEHRGTFVLPFVRLFICSFVPPPHQAPQASNLASETSDLASQASNPTSQASNLASQVSN